MKVSSVQIKIQTWRERIGAGPDFPLHMPTEVERAMVAQIADLEAALAHALALVAERLTETNTQKNPE